MRNQRDAGRRDDLRQRRRSSRTSRAATPPAARRRTRSRKNRLPATNWRASASPPGMLVSDSTHMPADRHEPALGHALRGSARTAPGSAPSSRRTAGPRSGEDELRVGVHQLQHVRERPGAPCGRSRASATARPSRCARARRRAPGARSADAGLRQHVGQLGPARLGGAGHVVGVDDVDQPAPAPAGSRRAAAGPSAARRPARTASRRPAPAPRPARRAARRRRRRAGRAGRRPRSPGRPAGSGRRSSRSRRPGWTPPRRRGRPRSRARRTAGPARCAARRPPRRRPVRGVGESLGLEAGLHAREPEVDRRAPGACPGRSSRPAPCP